MAEGSAAKPSRNEAQPSGGEDRERLRAAGKPAWKKRRTLLIVAGIAAVVILGALIYHLANAGKESTDDAQIDADVVQLAPRVAGRVAAVAVAENQAVRRGDLVLRLDDRDYEARAAQASAEVDSARAQLEQARATLASREADLALAKTNLRRTRELRRGRSIAPQQVDQTRAQYDAATAGHEAARAAETYQQARLKSAEAALALARLDLEWTRIVAPDDGVVSGITAHPAAFVAVGQTVAQFVPRRKYVTANFKETQIARMRPGERADVAVDTYGTSVRGTVESLSAGTGARFSLLPPENATGNFVKIAQRIPVRIALDDVPPGMALRAGQSVNVTVHVSD